MTIKVINDIEELFKDAKVADRISRDAYGYLPDQLKSLLSTGDYAVRLDIEREDLKNLCIFYEIIESEYKEDRKIMKNTPHITLTRAYSSLCVDGELGNTHFVGLLPILKESFDSAKERSWDVSMDEVNGWVRQRLFASSPDGTAD